MWPAPMSPIVSITRSFMDSFLSFTHWNRLPSTLARPIEHPRLRMVVIVGSLLTLSTEGPHGNRKIQASQPFPEILSADADGASGLGHLPVMPREFLQQ